MKKKQNGGKRPGAGRPKGSVSKSTIEIRKEAQKMKQRIAKNTYRLMNAQLSVALGCSYLMRIDYDQFGKPKKPVIVEDIEEITAFLDGEFEGLDAKRYYEITTERPDTKAIDSLLDRGYGRPTQTTKHEGGETPIEINYSEEARKRIEKYE